jgi:hypothetical protein
MENMGRTMKIETPMCLLGDWASIIMVKYVYQFITGTALPSIMG